MAPAGPCERPAVPESLEQARTGNVKPTNWADAAVFTPHGWEDYRDWQSIDKATVKRINRLLDDVLRETAERDRQARAAPTRPCGVLVTTHRR